MTEAFSLHSYEWEKSAVWTFRDFIDAASFMWIAVEALFEALQRKTGVTPPIFLLVKSLQSQGHGTSETSEKCHVFPHLEKLNNMLLFLWHIQTQQNGDVLCAGARAHERWSGLPFLLPIHSRQFQHCKNRKHQTRLNHGRIWSKAFNQQTYNLTFSLSWHELYCWW